MNENILAEYLTAVAARFQAAHRRGVDLEAWPRFEAMLDYFNRYQHIRPGHFEYLINRTHPRGKYPNYRQHRGYDCSLGSIPDCPVHELQAIVNWRLPVSRELQTLMAQLGYNLRQLRQQQRSVVSDNAAVTDLFDWS